MSEQLAYHATVAVMHFGGKLGRNNQAKSLLGFMWACSPSPWTCTPKIFLSASRLSWLIASRTSRSRAIGQLIKVGALRKASKPTRSGTAYELLRPALSALSDAHKKLIVNPSPRDYLYHPDVSVLVDADAVPKLPKTKQVKPAKLERKVLTAYLRTLSITMGGKARRVSWPITAYLIEKLCGLSKGAVRYTKSSKDVEAFATWLYTNSVKPAEFMTLWRLLKSKHASKPTGNELRWVFEDNTPAKSEYLRCVLADLRPCLQATPGDEQ